MRRSSTPPGIRALIAVCAASGCTLEPSDVAPPSLAPSALASEPRGATVTVDLSDDWAPLPFGLDEQGEGPSYRETYVALANEELGRGAEWRRARRDRYFELYGVFPSLAVVRDRLLDEPRHRCHDRIDAGRRPTARMRAHLRCEGFLEPGEGGARRMRQAIKLYQRRHMLLPTGRLDDDTLAAMEAGSRELDFRQLLRVLRERVADAAGLIEDGSAAGSWGQVLGRDLHAAEFRAAWGSDPPERAAEDLISQATERAALQLGWTSPEEAARWFAGRRPESTARLLVPIELPEPPDYHRPGTSYRAEIHRGDREAGIRPSLTLYAQTDDGEIALVRWPTTTGGWQWETTPDGEMVRAFKASPLGPRVWRYMVVAPAWLPPRSTPVEELVRSWDGGWALRQDAIGPGYASAYGLVMLMHEREDDRGGELRYRDQGIRTHGSVHIASIRRGHSHGCHRLFNHQALRLASFLLHHHPHVRRGPLPAHYERRIVWEDGTARWLRRDSRGYLWELIPPVPVVVLDG
jgi:hypothetical protein